MMDSLTLCISFAALAALTYEFVRFIWKITSNDYVSRKKVERYLNEEIIQLNKIISDPTTYAADKVKAAEKIQMLTTLKAHLYLFK